MIVTPTLAAQLIKNRTWDFRFDILNAGGAVTRVATNILSCSVENNDLADIKRTCKIEMAITDPTIQGMGLAPVVNQLSERLRPWALLKMDDGTWFEFPMGTFYLVSGSQRRASAAGQRSIPFDGYDGLIVLRDDKTTDRIVYPATTNYVNAAKVLLVSAGFPAHTITLSGKQMPSDMEWEPGTPKLEIINALLSAINYVPLAMDPMGVPTSHPYTDPQSTTALWDYTINADSVVMPGIETSLDLFNQPNTWVGFVSQPDRPVLRSVYVNDDPASSTSTVNRGRTITQVLTEEVKDAVDQATLDDLVIRFAKESSQQFEEAQWSTGLMPFHETGDVVTLNYGLGQFKFRETQWSMELRAGAEMKHSARRTVVI